MGRSVADVALLFAVLSGQEPVAPGERSPRFVHATSWRTDHPPTDRRGRAVRRSAPVSGTPVERRDVATLGPDVVNDEFVVLLLELVDDLGAYLTSRPGGGVHSLADVVAHDQAHAGSSCRGSGHELFLQALATSGRSGDGLPRCPGTQPRMGGVRPVSSPALVGADVLVLLPTGRPGRATWWSEGMPGPVSSWVTTPAAIAGWPIMSVPVGTVHGLPSDWP